jgi:hypothetical protein
MARGKRTAWVPRARKIGLLTRLCSRTRACDAGSCSTVSVIAEPEDSEAAVPFFPLLELPHELIHEIAANLPPHAWNKFARTSKEALTVAMGVHGLIVNAEVSQRLREGSTMYAFQGNYAAVALSSLEVHAGVTSISSSAFNTSYTLTRVTLPEGLTTIGNSAFIHCTSLTSITLPSSLKTIGTWAFGCCNSLISVAVPHSVTSIGENAFCYCYNLESVTLPNSLKTIHDCTFSCCKSIDTLTLPAGLTTIGKAAFCYCRALHSLALPEALTSIHDEAFFSCSSLVSVVLPRSLATVGKTSFLSASLDAETQALLSAINPNIIFTHLAYRGRRVRDLGHAQLPPR